jgi:sulfatase modifying factor 1
VVLVWVPGLRFVMGQEDGDEDERPLRAVDVPGFFLGKHEVSWAEYLAFCSATGRAAPSRHASIGGRDFEAPLDHPVVQVSWDDAQGFCAWAGLRLPSEAEWERAARGDHGGPFPWGDAPAGADRLNCADAAAVWPWPADVVARGAAKAPWNDGHPFTAPAGAFPAGAAPCGALNLAGNVSEWVQDRYAPTYEGAPADGTARDGPGGEGRVFRGGSYFYHLRIARSSYRARTEPGRRYPGLGFRVALSAR